MGRRLGVIRLTATGRTKKSFSAGEKQILRYAKDDKL